MKVQLLISRELVEQWLCLGDRRIVGVAFAETGFEIEPTAQMTLTIDDPDAPDGATVMEPIYVRAADGTVAMASVGYR